MSDFQDNLRDRMGALREIARDALDAVGGEFADDEARKANAELLEHLRDVLTHALLVVERSDGTMVSSSAFNGLNEALVIVRDAIAENPGAAGQWADQVLVALSGFPVVRGHDDDEAMREAAAKFTHSTNTRLGVVKRELGKVRRDLEATQGTLDEQRAAFDLVMEERRAAVDAQVAEFRGSAESVLNEVRAAVDTERQRIESTMTEQNETFRAAQDERAERFEQTVSEARQLLRESLERQQGDADELLDELKRMEQETRKLVGVIGELGTTERYTKEVKEQRKAADAWRWITVGVVVVAAGVAIWASTHAGSVDSSQFVGKLAISALLAGLAAWTAKQSSRHRDREEMARRLELDMAAFAPFIEPMDPEQKSETRMLMFDRSFGNQTVAKGDGGGPSVLSLLRRGNREDGGADAV